MPKNLKTRFEFSIPKQYRHVQQDPDIDSVWHYFIPGILAEYHRELRKIAQDYNLEVVERRMGYDLVKPNSKPPRLEPVVRVGLETVELFEPSYEKSQDLLKIIAEKVFKSKIPND